MSQPSGGRCLGGSQRSRGRGRTGWWRGRASYRGHGVYSVQPSVKISIETSNLYIQGWLFVCFVQNLVFVFISCLLKINWKSIFVLMFCKEWDT